MKIYVAASWRTPTQPEVVAALREDGHEVYDFRNPDRGSLGRGFSWKEIDGGWESWTPAQYRAALKHPLAVEGFNADEGAIRWCDALVLVQPSGRSAAVEFGYAVGLGKRTLVLLAKQEPELMLALADLLCVDLDELRDYLREMPEGR